MSKLRTEAHPGPPSRRRPGRPRGAATRARPPRRDEILAALLPPLAALEGVHAIWEAGVASWGQIDRWSDIDLNVDCDDERVGEVFPVVERALRSLAPLALNYRIPHPEEHAYQQAFYRLRGCDPCLLIDLAVFRRSAEDKFLEPETHGPARILFERPPGIRPPKLDRRGLARRIRARRERLRLRFEAFGCFVSKEIGRENWIEAFENYKRVYLDTLLELLRMRFHPVHFEFGFRYVHRELPPRVLRRLQPLYFVRDAADLGRKRRAAERWIREELRAGRGAEGSR